MIRKIPWILVLNDLCTLCFLLLEKQCAVEKTLAKYAFINHDCLHIVRTLFISTAHYYIQLLLKSFYKKFYPGIHAYFEIQITYAFIDILFSKPKTRNTEFL